MTSPLEAIQVYISDGLQRLLDLKNLMSAQPVKLRILHYLHRLSKPKTVINSISPEVRKALLSSLNALETLLVKQWVAVELSMGNQTWDFRGSKTLQMMNEASKVSLS